MTRGRGRRAGKKRHPLVRLARFAVVAAVSLFATYLIAANVFLSSALFERFVDGRPEKLDVRFERAWSLFPQHVHARKLTIRGRDSGNEWWIRFERVEFEVSLSSIFKRRFEASHVRGNGVAFLFRKRPDVAPSAEELATLPRIPGFPAYTVRAPRPPPSAIEPPYRKITLDLHDIVLDDVRDVWVQHGRFVGSARVEGHLYFKPKREIEVSTLHVGLWNGRISNRGRRFADSFDGSTFDIAFRRHGLRTGTREQFIAGLAIGADAHANIRDAARLPGLAGHVSGPLEFRRAVVRIADGRLRRGTHLVATSPGILLTPKRHHASAAVNLELEVERGADGRERMASHTEFGNVAVWHRDGPTDEMRPLIHAPRVLTTADATALDLGRLFEDLHVVVDVPDSHMRNAGKLSKYFPPATPAAVERGGARATLHFEAWRAERRGTASARIHADDLDFRLARMRVRGRAVIGIELGAIHFDTHRLDNASLTIHLEDGLLSSTRAPNRSLVRVTNSLLIARAASVDLADPLRDVDVSIAVPSADVVSGSLLQAYLPKGSEMKLVTEGSRYALSIDVAVKDHLARGMFRLRSHVLRVAFHDFRLTGHLDVRARVRNWRWTTGQLALDEARVEIGQVTMTRAGSSKSGLTMASIGIAAKSPHFNLVDPLARVRLTAWFEGAKVKDVGTMNAFLAHNSTFRFEGNDGTFRAHLDLDVAKHTAKGTLHATASNVGVAGRVLHLRSDTELIAEFVNWRFDRRTVEVRDAHIELTRVSGRLGGHTRGPDLFADRLLIGMASPKLDLGQPSLEGSDFRLAIGNAEIPNARALSPLLPQKRMLDIQSGVARINGDLRVSHARRNAMGNFDIGLTRAELRMRDMRVSGDFRFRVQLAGFDPDRRVLNLSGTRLEMRNIAVTGATAATTNWRGDIELPYASLRLRPMMKLDTILRLDARDARPLLAILFEGDLPKIVLRLTDVPHLAASARLIAASHELALVDLEARGGNVAVRGSYAVRNGIRRGALIFKKAFVSLGLRVDNSGVHPRLFRLNGWLEDRTCDVAELLEVKRSGC